MLRLAQHERNITMISPYSPFALSLSKGERGFFSEPTKIFHPKLTVFVRMYIRHRKIVIPGKCNATRNPESTGFLLAQE